LTDSEAAAALWSYPEILRVDAELILQTRSANAEKAAEAKLLRSLDLARSASLLSFELRSATSLARIWYRTKRKTKARDLLESAYGKFTEGFATSDLSAARQLIDELG
jgi:predicted ATPase